MVAKEFTQGIAVGGAKCRIKIKGVQVLGKKWAQGLFGGQHGGIKGRNGGINNGGDGAKEGAFCNKDGGGSEVGELEGMG